MVAPSFLLPPFHPERKEHARERFHPDNRWYVTTPFPTSTRPHIGFAFQVILTDALARYHH
jgi:leucyl-tRNA synthetase